MFDAGILGLNLCPRQIGAPLLDAYPNAILNIHPALLPSFPGLDAIGQALEGGMPVWKFVANVLLTAIANIVFLKYFTEIHSGFRAYSRRYLETVNLEANSDDFVFDTEIIAQGVACGMNA